MREWQNSDGRPGREMSSTTSEASHGRWRRWPFCGRRDAGPLAMPSSRRLATRARRGSRGPVPQGTREAGRHQHANDLLLLRLQPGFEPSPEAFAPAVRALNASRRSLAANGVEEPRHLDLWTAITTGLVDQQIANDPGGTRWSLLIEELVDMFLAHCRTVPPAPARRIRSKASQKTESNVAEGA